MTDTFVFVNDQPYRDGQEDPLESLRDTLAFSVDDWGASRAKSWVWGIVLGWDEEAMAEQAVAHGWDASTTARLDRLHAAFAALAAPARPDSHEVSTLASRPPISFGGTVIAWPDEGRRITIEVGPDCCEYPDIGERVTVTRHAPARPDVES